MSKRKSEQPAAEEILQDGVTVRMFCQGLGDCFLISVPQEGSSTYHILIDCGVAMGTKDGPARMQDVVKQIGEIANGVVDLLIITHEHWDHISAFTQASFEEPKKIIIKHLWMAWTEDPQDDLAAELRKDYGKAKAAAFNALAALHQTKNQPGMDKVRLGVEGVLAFYGLDPALGPGPLVAAAKARAKKAGSGDLASAIKTAKALVGDDTSARTYLRPGETHDLPNAARGSLAGGIKARVLGPPHSAPKIRKLNSSTETYEKKGHLHFGGVSWAWMWALADNPAAGLAIDEDAAMPFEKTYRVPLSQTKRKQFFRSHYYSSPKGAKAEQAEGFLMRRIDGDWLARGAQQLALWINGYTNNVSLVLALELPKSKKVLLFVGDAQVGNWLSWHEITSFKDSANKDISMQALFGKTILYKVGHHGSHNATLRQKGLELMTHPDLVAMLPVDAERATKLGYGEMPLESLQAAIRERAGGRLLRLDKPWQNDDEMPGEWPSNLFKPKVVRHPQHSVPYMEYTVRDKPDLV